jgi:hypothetical protein
MALLVHKLKTIYVHHLMYKCLISHSFFMFHFLSSLVQYI